MYVRVRKAGKRGEGGSKLVLAQKRLEGLRKLSKLQHFSERENSDPGGEGKGISLRRGWRPIAVHISALCALRRARAKLDLSVAALTFHSLGARGKTAASSPNCCPPCLCEVLGSYAQALWPPGLEGESAPRQICFKNPVKRARVPSLSRTCSGSGAQQPDLAVRSTRGELSGKDRYLAGCGASFTSSLPPVSLSNPPPLKGTPSAAEPHRDPPSCLWSQNPKMLATPHRHRAPQPVVPLSLHFARLLSARLQLPFHSSLSSLVPAVCGGAGRGRRG